MTSTAGSRNRVARGFAAVRAGAAGADLAARNERRWRTVQLALFVTGAVLMPVGLVAIAIGWYGTAHSRYAYDQTTYLISGGILGLGLILFGGFLYFGALLAKSAHDQRLSSQQLSDTVRVLAELMARGAQPGATVDSRGDTGAEPVLAGAGSTVHRRDCALVRHRDDLRPVTGHESGLGACRVCRPGL